MPRLLCAAQSLVVWKALLVCLAPDEPPAPEPAEATVEIGRVVMAAIVHATEAIETALANAQKLVRSTRLFATTMDDAITRLESAAASMTALMEG